MPDRVSAQIIQFPQRPARPPEQPAEATGSLSIALAKQHAAIQRWNDAMTDLTESMQGLAIPAQPPKAQSSNPQSSSAQPPHAEPAHAEPLHADTPQAS